MKGTVLVAMSGGIDSAMTALLLREQGYQVTGLHMHFVPPLPGVLTQLQQLSAFLGLEILRYDAHIQFRDEVIWYMVDMHSEGRTPSLCARCNPKLKWKVLNACARSRNIDRIATGHYIRLQEESGIVRLYRAVDERKDQSYYLWGLQQDVLQKALCPLGHYTKEQVKAMALERGLGFLVKEKESVGLCFAQGRSYEEILCQETPPGHAGRQPGTVVDAAGKPVGKHKGYLSYTIGQKKDLDLYQPEKWCVSQIDAGKNELQVAPWQELYKYRFILSDYCFADPRELFALSNITTRVRGFGLNPGGYAQFEALPDGRLSVTLQEPAWAIAKGQPAVFYSGDRLLGGGLVDEVEA